MGMRLTLPKAGVFAQGQGEVVANNLAVSITKKGRCGSGAVKAPATCKLQSLKALSSRAPSFLILPGWSFISSQEMFLEKVRLEKEWLKPK